MHLSAYRPSAAVDSIVRDTTVAVLSLRAFCDRKQAEATGHAALTCLDRVPLRGGHHRAEGRNLGVVLAGIEEGYD